MIEAKYNGDDTLTIPVDTFKELTSSYISYGTNKHLITDLKDFIEFLNNVVQ